MKLRWVLLILGVVFLAALAWWERRRPRLDAGSERAEPREAAPAAPAAPLPLPQIRSREPLATRELPIVEVEPDTDRVPVLGALTLPEPLTATPAAQTAPPADSTAAAPEPMPQAAVADAPLPDAAGAHELLVDWPPEDQRRIVSLRLVAAQPERFAGRSLRQALVAEGFVLGRFDIFHKPDEAQRAVLSAASLTHPGTFDEQTMDSQHFGGLSLFAVLPGPKPPPQAFDELLFTARNLNQRLHGLLQDELGSPLTPARVALLRERLSSEMAS